MAGESEWGGRGSKVFHTPQTGQSRVGRKKEKKTPVEYLPLIFFIPATAPSSPNPENTISQVACRADMRDNLRVCGFFQEGWAQNWSFTLT